MKYGGATNLIGCGLRVDGLPFFQRLNHRDITVIETLKKRRGYRSPSLRPGSTVQEWICAG
jgi:hypothetical protein